VVVGTDVDGTNSTFMMIWDETVAVVGGGTVLPCDSDARPDWIKIPVHLRPLQNRPLETETVLRVVAWHGMFVFISTSTIYFVFPPS
jgi:hypothetical protein